MNKIDLAYIAGIVDGEGSIMLNKYKNNIIPCISISNNDLSIINFVHKRFGGAIVKKQPRKPTHKLSYDLRLVYNKAINFINLIYPFLQDKSKKRKAKMINIFHNKLIKRNGKYTNQEIIRRNKFIKSFRSS
jgi:hypothetical protein